MRVGVNTLFLIPDEVGGSEVYVRRLLPAMRKLAPDLTWVVFTNRENHDSFAGYERVRMDVRAQSRARRVLAEQTSLVRAARAASLDLLFSPGYTAPLRAPCPQVVTILDTQFVAFPEDFPWFSRMAQRILIRKAAQRARRVLTISEFSRSQITTHLGVPPEKVAVTPLAADPLFGRPAASPIERPFVLCVSNTYLHKNARRLVAAFASIAAQIPHGLVLVGQPRAGEPPPHPRVKRIHRVSESELAGLYQACDLFVFPSMYEGFGLPVIEAMTAGARVVAAKAAAIPEVAGDAASFFDPTREDDIARAMLQALREPPEERQRFIEAGRTRAAQFSWEKCARQTLEAFRAVLDRSL